MLYQILFFSIKDPNTFSKIYKTAHIRTYLQTAVIGGKNVKVKIETWKGHSCYLGLLLVILRGIMLLPKTGLRELYILN